jgi:hypothetical protein
MESKEDNAGSKMTNKDNAGSKMTKDKPMTARIISSSVNSRHFH